jgi:Zn-dependent peptidase ImmA (M78 family)
MINAFRIKMAKQKAEGFVKEEKISALPIDPMAIAATRGIEVRAKPETAEGVSGMLLRSGNQFGILYATHIASSGFQRFSVSHELGHYFLDGHVDQILPGDGIHQSRAGFVTADQYELEADNFAAGLLMPDHLFKRVIGKHAPGLGAVEAAAETCLTSLTATAIRYSELSSHAVAAIISTGPLIDYCFLSTAMKSLPGLSWLRKGTPVPTATLTDDLNRSPKRILNGERVSDVVDVRDWLGGTMAVKVTEEAMGLGPYGKTLTILSSKWIGQEDGSDDNEEEQDLRESWTPRFRK